VTGLGTSISISPGQALWNQREAIAALRDQFKALRAAVDHPSDLNLYQWAELAAFALEFRPDLIIELGRGFGNSTCCFIEVAHRLGGADACRVVSVCLNDDWFSHSVPRLSAIVPPEWFAPAQIQVGNLLEYDVAPVLAYAKRCLVFWDAHGYKIAEWVLGKLLPQLVGKRHFVLMHDLSDSRFEVSGPEYGEQGLWQGTDETIWRCTRAITPTFWIGHVSSSVPQTISVVDFTSRNQLPLHSAAQSLHREIASHPARMAELKELLGDELFSLQAKWFWFTLDEASTPLSFPVYTSAGSEREATNLGPEIHPNEEERRFARLRQAAKCQLSDQDLDRLTDAVERYGPELAEIPQEKQRLEALWLEIQGSAGWRILNRCRAMRNRYLRNGTQGRKLYDFLLQFLRGGVDLPSSGK
jgi:hypothetical protein